MRWTKPNRTAGIKAPYTIRTQIDQEPLRKANAGAKTVAKPVAIPLATNLATILAPTLAPTLAPYHGIYI